MTTRTVQLRQYRIHDGEFQNFVEWFRDILLPAKVGYGYHLEFAYGDEASSLITWAVSLEGDVAGFDQFDEHWMASTDRADAFEGVPQRIAEKWITYPTPIA